MIRKLYKHVGTNWNFTYQEGIINPPFNETGITGLGKNMNPMFCVINVTKGIVHGLVWSTSAIASSNFYSFPVLSQLPVYNPQLDHRIKINQKLKLKAVFATGILRII